MQEPLYTAKECEEEIARIQALIRSISSKPVGASAQGVGNSHYIGRLSDLRKERSWWLRELEVARAFEQNRRGGAQGPKQVIE